MVNQTKRWTDVLLSFVTVRLALWVALVAYFAPGWLDGPWNLMEYMDDHQHHGLDLVGRVAYLKYHQFPLWNPFWCGGIYGMAEPETIYLAPDFIVRALLWGPERGRHIVLFVMMVVGLEGMFRLCRKHDCSVIGATFAAAIYCTQYTVVHAFVHDGSLNFLTGFELIPWVLLCFYEGIDSFPWRLLGGFFTAWIFLCAGTYSTPFTLLTLLLCVLTATATAWFAGPRNSWRKPWISLVTMGVVAFLLSLAKLLPLLGFLGQHKRVWLVVEAHAAQTLFNDLTTRYPWLLIFALVAVFFFDRMAAFFIGAAALFFLMAMGDFDALAPYHFIRKLPLFSQLRNPERYMMLVMLFLSLAAARGLTQLEDLLPAVIKRVSSRNPLPRLFHAVVVGVAAAALAFAVYPRTKDTLAALRVPAQSLFTFDAPRPMEQPFRQARGNRRDVHVFNYAGMGSLACITGIVVPMSTELRADLPAEEYPLDPTKATVKRVEWTPNRIDLEVTASEPTRVVINQNWNAHFRASVGTVVSHQGLLAIDVPAGTHKLRVAYVDRLFDVAIVISGFTLLCLIGYAVWYGGRRIAHGVRRFRTLPWLPGEDVRSV